MCLSRIKIPPKMKWVAYHMSYSSWEVVVSWDERFSAGGPFLDHADAKEMASTQASTVWNWLWQTIPNRL